MNKLIWDTVMCQQIIFIAMELDEMIKGISID